MAEEWYYNNDYIKFGEWVPGELPVNYEKRI